MYTKRPLRSFGILSVWISDCFIKYFFKINVIIFFKPIFRSINMENMRESKIVVNRGLDTPNGLGVDWIANNIYWTDNEYKVKLLKYV